MILNFTWPGHDMDMTLLRHLDMLSLRSDPKLYTSYRTFRCTPYTSEEDSDVYGTRPMFLTNFHFTCKPNNRMTSRQNEDKNYLNEMQHCPVQGIKTGNISSGGKTECLALQLQEIQSCLSLVSPV